MRPYGLEGEDMWGMSIKRLEEKLDRVIQGQEEIRVLLEELRDHPAGDKLQEGINAILGYTGPRGGAE